jgi:hypothetical protein
MKRQYIVAEISKTYRGYWPPGLNANLEVVPGECLGGLFEQVIATNLERGYELHEWKLAVAPLMVDVPEQVFGKGAGKEPQLTETIIAIFKLIRKAG